MGRSMTPDDSMKILNSLHGVAKTLDIEASRELECIRLLNGALQFAKVVMRQ